MQHHHHKDLGASTTSNPSISTSAGSTVAFVGASSCSSFHHRAVSAAAAAAPLPAAAAVNMNRHRRHAFTGGTADVGRPCCSCFFQGTGSTSSSSRGRSTSTTLLYSSSSSSNKQSFDTTTTTATTTSTATTIQPQPQPQPQTNKAKPRTGLSQKILDWALASPFWKLVLVPQARNNIVQTAEANGIAWKKCYDWFYHQNGPWRDEDDDHVHGDSAGTGTGTGTGSNHHGIGVPRLDYPSYYTKEFHAYPNGNLSWEAAIEQELASRAVGARNFPSHGAKGEDVFRSSFEQAIIQLGGNVPKGGIVVDFGCGTGTSTRRLSKLFLQADKFVGIDLSPYFIAVGQRLLELCPTDKEWVTSIDKDDRIELRVGNIVDTNIDNDSVDAVNISLVIHELPIHVTLQVCQEALRILKPGGQLYISEMDFDSPAYAAQRENAMLFSLLRSTEPYLDEYADGVDQVRDYLRLNCQSVKITAATGRHFALVATKKEKKKNKNKTKQQDQEQDDDEDDGLSSLLWEDTRFDSQGNYAVVDTHLKVWESKK
eukprot:CAMPEP_0176481446 /NCGR_PEP_ID=MMETSP0200_2-20121128/2823_1 /TAXON_ID=947934 /ORGANISM="Chaetoceros sp., Strain GSL56" /LENGTH=540 /DNA_ID=CAMNT_0017877649 /DNA_START=117 /DNA_END=1739 /DNA_ORIENTATION=-